MPNAICRFEGCERLVHARGWCRMHWRRWRRTGDPGGKSAKHGEHVKEQKRSVGQRCAVAICDELAVRRIWCNAHYRAWLKYKDPLEDRTVYGAENPSWRDWNISYETMHAIRLLQSRGRASEHPCIDCGAQAKDWSYNNAADIELIDEWGKRYSFVVSDYDPRCKPCHNRFDRAYAVA
jgi:hypothetical protein